jgi:putative transcriptional regulator
MSEPLEGFVAPTEEPATGRLLVATAALLDPNFARSVVLLLDHDEDGSLGVVLNRPSPVPVRSVLPAWGSSAGEPSVLFEGGPVSPDAALAVACVPDLEDSEPLGFRRLFGTVGIVDLDTPTEVLAPAVTDLRIFAGYAGWGASQLEAEIEEGSWVVVDSTVHDVFSGTPATLWSEVLRRQPGELAWMSTRPADPTQN